MLKTIDRHRKANLEISHTEMFQARTERFVDLFNRRTIGDAHHRNHGGVESMNSISTNESDRSSNELRSADVVLQSIDRLHRPRHCFSKQNGLVSCEKKASTDRFAYTFEFLSRTFFVALNQRSIICQEMIFRDPTMRRAAPASISCSHFEARKVLRVQRRVALENLSE